MKTDRQKVWKSEEANDEEEEQMKDIKAKQRTKLRLWGGLVGTDSNGSHCRRQSHTERADEKIRKKLPAN